MQLRSYSSKHCLVLFAIAGTLILAAVIMAQMYQSGEQTAPESDARTTTVAGEPPFRTKSAKSKTLADVKDIEIWYRDNTLAIQDDTINSIRALFKIVRADESATEFSEVEERVLDRAKATAVADLDKAKARLLAELAENPKGVPAPPIYKVRSEKEHLDEIRKTKGAGK